MCYSTYQIQQTKGKCDRIHSAGEISFRILVCVKETNWIDADCYKQCFRYDEWFFHAVPCTSRCAELLLRLRSSRFAYRSIKYESSSLSTWIRKSAIGTGEFFIFSFDWIFIRYDTPNYLAISRARRSANGAYVSLFSDRIVSTILNILRILPLNAKPTHNHTKWFRIGFICIFIYFAMISSAFCAISQHARGFSIILWIIIVLRERDCSAFG